MWNKRPVNGSSRPPVPEWAVLAFGLAAFLCLAAWQLWLPGPHYDEAREAGLPAMQLLRGLPVEAFRGSGIRIGGVLLPLMVVDYIGATNVFLALPFLAVGGVNVVALRLLPVALSAVALVLLYLLARRLYNRRTATVAFLLLAVNPSFVFWSRQGVFVTSTIIPLGLAATYCLVQWVRGGARGWLAAATFLLGIGLYTKFLFAWWIAGLAAATLLLGAPSVLVRLRKTQRASSGLDLAAGGAALAVGLAPLILYNLQTGGTWGVIGRNLSTSYYGTNNLAFLQNLGTRWNQLIAVASGAHLWYLGAVFENRLWYAAPALLVIAIILTAVRKTRWRRLAFPWLVGTVILLSSCFTVSALWPTHFALLTPWLPLAVAVCADAIWAAGRRLTVSSILVGLVLAGVWAADVVVDVRYHGALALSGGLGGHTSAVYELAATLDRQGLQAPAAIDWGIAAPVDYLTEGRVRPIELFGYDWGDNAGFRERVDAFLDNPDMVYVFHVPSEAVFPRLDAFNAQLAEKGKTSRTEQVIRQRDGKPIFTLVRVGDAK